MNARLPLPTAPPVKREACRSGPQTCSGRIVFLLASAMLVHTTAAAPVHHSGNSALQTPHSLGTTNLCSRKHSFRRAQRQELDTGSAVYRGRCMSAKQLGVEWKSVKPSKQRIPKRVSSHQQIRVITWNSGGLNPARQAEVRTWLSEESRSNPSHVLCIQETRWPTSCEYKDGPWTCIHSGSGTREGGVLIMLNTQISQIRTLSMRKFTPVAYFMSEFAAILQLIFFAYISMPGTRPNQSFSVGLFRQNSS